MTPVPAFEHRRIIGIRVDASSYAAARQQVIAWARRRESRYVVFSTVAGVMEAHDSSPYRAVMEQADLVTSDGMPLVWLLRALGIRAATRVYGPDLMPFVLEAAAREGIRVGFYGGTQQVLAQLLKVLERRFPGLDIGYAESPPFRALTPQEDERVTRKLQDAGVRILFVGIGSPKQDHWMHAHRGRIPAVMLGVGAAFDFMAGAKPQAPDGCSPSDSSGFSV